MPYEYPVLKNHQFKVMPDHVHILIQLLYRTGKPLDHYIEQLLENIAKKFSRIRGKEINYLEIFEPGFCDKPLYDDRSLDGWYNYIRENPHRLAMRLQYPVFFQRIRNLKIGEKEYDAYGNLFLLRNPDKVCVKMSYKYSEEIRQNKIEAYKDHICNGTILVSPFIHPDEKMIRKHAEEAEGKIILIRHEQFGERYKPAQHEFNQCSSGNLLIISAGYPEGTPLSKGICMEMNNLAKIISEK